LKALSSRLRFEGFKFRVYRCAVIGAACVVFVEDLSQDATRDLLGVKSHGGVYRVWGLGFIGLSICL
jgi:hypothetical protein